MSNEQGKVIPAVFKKIVQYLEKQKIRKAPIGKVGTDIQLNANCTAHNENLFFFPRYPAIHEALLYLYERGRYVFKAT